jgi:DNA-directed RNA polymerase subunit RPC12/RpoP
VTIYTTYKCDRCGFVFDEHAQRHDVQLERMIASMNVNQFIDTRHYNLCDPCGNELRNFLKERTA